MENIDSAIRIIEENDPNESRSAKVATEFQNYLTCYKELHRGEECCPPAESQLFH
jgi:hypothetical protein